MFNDEVTTSDAFMDMPDSSQVLYFHLGMSADDDGFVSNPKMIMRATGKKDDDYKILVLKKFLIHFQDEGVCVVKHWRINNNLRKDRYTETKYIHLKERLFIRENGAYTLNPQNALPVPKGHFLVGEKTDQESTGYTLVDQRLPSGQPSIGKDRLGKDRLDIKKQTKKVFVKPTLEEVKAYCDERKNGIDPQAFLDSNEAKGWVIGKNKTPAKDWKAMIRTWENFNKARKQEEGSKTNNLNTQHSSKVLSFINKNKK